MGRFKISGAVRGVIVEDPSAIAQDEGPGVHGPRSSVQSIEDLLDAGGPVPGLLSHRDGRLVLSICLLRAGGLTPCSGCMLLYVHLELVRCLHLSSVLPL